MRQPSPALRLGLAVGWVLLSFRAQAAWVSYQEPGNRAPFGRAGWGADAPAIDVDAEGFPHLAWQLAVRGESKIGYAYWTGIHWEGLAGSDSGATVSRGRGDARSPSLALDSRNRPHIAWEQRLGGSSTIYYAFWDGERWATLAGADEEGGISSSRGSSTRPSLALDSKGHPHIAWEEDSGGGTRVAYSFWDGARWVRRSPILQGSSIQPMLQGSRRPSLALDRQDHPHLAWEEPAGGGGNIRYAFWDGSSWSAPYASPEPVNEQAGSAREPSLCLDSMDRPHIVWTDESSGGGQIYYAYLERAQWRSHGGAHFDGGLSHGRGVSHDPSIRLDLEDHPHVVWVESTAANQEIAYAFWNGSEWETRGRETAGGGLSRTPSPCGHPSLSIDAHGWPHVAWTEGLAGDQEIRYLRYVNGHPRGAWMWEEGQVPCLGDRAMDEFISFSRRKEATLAILPFDGSADERLREIVHRLRANGIAPHAVAPRSVSESWCRVDNGGEPSADSSLLTRWARSVREFNASAELGGFEGGLIELRPGTADGECRRFWRLGTIGGPDARTRKMARTFGEVAARVKGILNEGAARAGILIPEEYQGTGGIRLDGSETSLARYLRDASDYLVLTSPCLSPRRWVLPWSPFAQSLVDEKDWLSGGDMEGKEIFVGTRAGCADSGSNLFRLAGDPSFMKLLTRLSSRPEAESGFGGVILRGGDAGKRAPQATWASGPRGRAVYLTEGSQGRLPDLAGLEAGRIFLATDLQGSSGLEAWLASARRHGMEVHAVAPPSLFPSWCSESTDQTSAVIDWAERAKQVGLGTPDTLAGVQVVLDPSQLEECGKAGSEPRRAVGAVLLNLLDRLEQALAGSDMQLGVGIPAEFTSRRTSLFAKRKDIVSYQVQDRSDYVVILDSSKEDPCGHPSNWILFQSEGEIDYARELGKRVFVRARKDCPNGMVPKSENMRKVRRMIEAALQEYGGMSSFAGLAVEGRRAFYEEASPESAGEK